MSLIFCFTDFMINGFTGGDNLWLSSFLLPVKRQSLCML